MSEWSRHQSEIQADEHRRELDIVGKVVASAVIGKDGSGCDMIDLTFTDGTFLTIKEIGQCGEIAVWLGFVRG